MDITRKIWQSIIIALLTSCLCVNAYAQSEDKPKILASSPAVALIASIVAGDDFIINSIHIEDGCPHHYHAKPSDKKKMSEADAVIYIDDSFETFFANMVSKFDGKTYQISNNSNVVEFSFNEDNPDINWHFWNNPSRVYMAIVGVGNWLIQIKPESKNRVLNRIETAKIKLLQLKKEKNAAIDSSGPIMLFSKSAQPFFCNRDYLAMFPGKYPSLKFITKLEMAIKAQPNICIISNVHDRNRDLLKYDVRQVKINSENWTFKQGEDPMEQYAKHINEMIAVVKSCTEQ